MRGRELFEVRVRTGAPNDPNTVASPNLERKSFKDGLKFRVVSDGDVAELKWEQNVLAGARREPGKTHLDLSTLRPDLGKDFFILLSFVFRRSRSFKIFFRF